MQIYDLDVLSLFNKHSRVRNNFTLFFFFLHSPCSLTKFYFLAKEYENGDFRRKYLVPGAATGVTGRVGEFSGDLGNSLVWKT